MPIWRFVCYEEKNITAWGSRELWHICECATQVPESHHVLLRTLLLEANALWAFEKCEAGNSRCEEDFCSFCLISIPESFGEVYLCFIEDAFQSPWFHWAGPTRHLCVRLEKSLLSGFWVTHSVSSWVRHDVWSWSDLKGSGRWWAIAGCPEGVSHVAEALGFVLDPCSRTGSVGCHPLWKHPTLAPPMGCGQRHLPQASRETLSRHGTSSPHSTSTMPACSRQARVGTWPSYVPPPAHWHNNQTFLPPLLAARIILLSLLEAGGPVLVTCPFLAGSRPFILGEC